jgi:hypothetical protein
MTAPDLSRRSFLGASSLAGPWVGGKDPAAAS